MDVRLPNGQVVQNVPEGTTRAQLIEKLQANGHDVSWANQPTQPAAAPAPPPAEANAVNLTTGERSTIPIERPFGSTPPGAADPAQLVRNAVGGRSISGEPMPEAPQGEFSKGVESGLQSTTAMLYGLSALVGDTIGSDALRDWGLKYHAQYTSEAAKDAPRVASLQDIHSLGDLFDFTSGMVGQSLPFMATTLAGGGVGGVVGRSVAKKAAERLVAKGLTKEAAELAVKRVMADPATQAKILSAIKTGANTGAFVASAGLQQGDLYGTLKEAGLDDVAATAWAYGAAQGALDVIPESRILGKLIAPKGLEKELTSAISRGLAGKVGKATVSLGKQAILEGSTEGAQQALSTLARIQSGGEEWGQKDTQALYDNLAGGAIVGTIFGGAADVQEALRTRTPKDSKPAPETIKPEPAQDLRAQFKSMLNPADGRDSMLVPTGQKAEDLLKGNIQKGVQQVETRYGTVLTTNAEKAARLLANPNISSEQMAELLYGQPVTSKNESDGTVVQARDAQGNVTAQVATNETNLARDGAAVAQTAGPGAKLETTTADAAIAERQARTDSAPLVELRDETPLDDAVILPARESHVVDLLRPALRRTREGRAALERLGTDPEFRGSVAKQYYDGGIDTKQLAASLTGREMPEAEKAPIPPDYHDDLHEFLRTRELDNLQPDEREAFYNWLITNPDKGGATADQRMAYESWREKQPGAKAPITNAVVLGQGGVVNGSVDPETRSPQSAKPWKSFARAEAEAARHERSDIDSEYHVRWVTAEQSLRMGLNGEGAYIFMQHKPGTEVFAGGKLGTGTAEQKTRNAIANGIYRAGKLSQTQKDVSRRTGYQHVVEFLRTGKDGKSVKVSMDARDIVQLGYETSAELQDPSMGSAERLFRSFQNGLAAIADSRINGERYTVLHQVTTGNRRRFSQPNVRNLILRDSGGVVRTLGQVRAAYSADSKAGRTAASSGSDRLGAGINEAPQFQGEPGREGGRAQQFIDETNPETAAKIDATPAFDRGRAEAYDPAAGRMDTEAAQNARSVRSVEPNADTSSKRKGTSGIGATTGNVYGTSVEPSMVRASFTSATLRRVGVGLQRVLTQLRSDLNIAHKFSLTDSPEGYERELINSGRSVADAALHRAKLEARLAAGEILHGQVLPGATHAVIWLNPKSDPAQLIKTFAHEVGHVYFDEKWDTASPQTRADVIGEWAKAQLSERESSRIVRLGEERAFKEWMADQMAAYVARNVEPKTVFEKFLSGVITGLKHVWERINSNYELSVPFAKFVKDTINHDGIVVERKYDGVFDSLGVGASTYDDASTMSGTGGWKQALRGKIEEHPKLNNVLEFGMELGRSAGGTILSSVQARIRRMNNPAFNAILRHFHLRPGETGGHTFYTASHATIQRYEGWIHHTLGKLTAAEQQHLLVEMQSEQGKYSTPKIAAAASELRGFFDNIRKYQLERGLPVMKVEHYFPQVADTAEFAKPDAFETIKAALQKANIEVDDAQLTAMIARLSDNNYAVQYDPKVIGSASETDLKSPFSQAMQPRYMPDDVRAAIRGIKDANGMSRFYAKDLYTVLAHYLTQSVTRAEFNVRLGDTEWVKVREDGTQRDFDPQYKLREKMNEAKSLGATQDQIAFMDEALQAFMGQYGRIKSEAWRKFQNGTLTYQNLRTLGLIFFSSLPDLANIAVRDGDMLRTMQTIKDNIREAWSANQPGELADRLRVLGHASDTVDQLSLMNFQELAANPRGLARKINEKFMRLIGMQRWTAFTRALALKAGIDYIKRHAERAEMGDADSMRRLKELDLDPADVKAWAANREQFVGEGGTTDANVPAAKVSGAISRFINEAVVHADPPEKTLWGNSEYWKLVWHLKNFMYGYTSRILGRLWHEMTREGATTRNKVQAALAFSTAIPITALGLEMKSAVQYGLWGNEDKKRKQMHAWQYLETLANRSGAFGVAQYGLDIGEARASGRAPLIAVLGPTASQFNDFAQYPLYRQLPGAIPGLSYFPGARDWFKTKLKGSD